MGLFILENIRIGVNSRKSTGSSKVDNNTLCHVSQYTWETDVNESLQIDYFQTSSVRLIQRTSHTITGSINPFPSLQAKHICNSHKPFRNQKLQKSLSSQLTERQEIIKHENTTRYIKHLAESANFKGGTFNKHRNGLIGNRFKMPNVSYTNPLWANLKTKILP